MNLIPDSNERDFYRQAFFDLHDTFGRDIVIWKQEQQTIISTDPNFNGFYPEQQNPTTVQTTQQSGTFKARIKYLSNQEIQEGLAGLKSSDNQPINIELGAVRIRLDISGFDYIKDATSITFDGEDHRVFQRDKRHGLFENDFYDFILQRVP